MLARHAAFTVIDFETTGSVRGLPDEPWQIGLVSLEGGELRGHREDFLRIDPGRPFNPYAPGRHAALRGVLAAAPSPAESFPLWRPWLEGRVLVAHNAGTERKILSSIAPLHRFGPWVDTLLLARRLLPGLPDHSLSAIVSAFGLAGAAGTACPSRTWHDALFDATATALLLRHLLSLPGWETLSLGALLASAGSPA